MLDIFYRKSAKHRFPSDERIRFAGLLRRHHASDIGSGDNMIFNRFDCDKIQAGYLRSICEGTSGLPEDMRESYVALWASGRGLLDESAPVDLTCSHRGEHIDWIECATCSNKRTRLKVFACAVHGKCVMASATEIKSCIGCQDRL